MTARTVTNLHTKVARLAVATFVATAACLALGTQSAQAYEQHETASYKSGTHHVILMGKSAGSSDEVNDIVVYDPESASKITAVKNSNSKVVKVAKSDDGTSITVTLKKAGRATVAYKYKGKTYKHTYVVQKYRNPVKTFKIGSKNYASKFKKAVFCDMKKHASGAKVSVVAASGWKLVQIQVAGMSPEKSVKNGYKLKKDDSIVAAVFKDKKTGAEQGVSIAS